MFNFDYELLLYLTVIAMIIDIFSIPFVQKTKGIFKTSKLVPLYALTINLVIGITVCYLFTNINFIYSLWVGLTSWLGADSIFKELEGKLTSHEEILKRKNISVPIENKIIFEEGEV